jgi:hypothetical protein
MPRKAVAPAVAVPAPLPVPQNTAPQVVSPAPNYDPYARPPALPATGVSAPGGPYGASAASTNGAASMGAPPPRAAQADFVNATFLWEFGRPVRATILGMRDATGTGKADYQTGVRANKRAWFLDFRLDAAHPKTGKAEATGRINEGDTRHQRLWRAYQGNVIGRNVILRLSTPGDVDEMTGKPTKAPWVLDPQ